LRYNAHRAAMLDDYIINGLLEQPKALLVFETTADGTSIEDAIGLGARRPDCGAFARVEDAKLDARFVGSRRHRAAQRVDLLDEVALADAPDGRVATHLPQRFQAVRQQQGVATHASSGQRGFGAGMASADDDHIKLARIVHR
jgi:hypothetical protein